MTVKVAVGPKADDEVAVRTDGGERDQQSRAGGGGGQGRHGRRRVQVPRRRAEGIHGLRFPSAQAAAAPTGRAATVTTEYKDTKTTHKVVDLRPLYKTAGGEVLSPLLMFKKTLKVDVTKIQKITANDSEDEPAWTVTDKDGEQTLTPLLKTTIDGKPAELEGLVGRVPAGYKLFPVHTIGEVEFEAADAGK